jgi:hypothetical protein
VVVAQPQVVLQVVVVVDRPSPSQEPTCSRPAAAAGVIPALGLATLRLAVTAVVLQEQKSPLQFMAEAAAQARLAGLAVQESAAELSMLAVTEAVLVPGVVEAGMAEPAAVPSKGRPAAAVAVRATVEVLTLAIARC